MSFFTGLSWTQKTLQKTRKTSGDFKYLHSSGGMVVGSLLDPSVGSFCKVVACHVGIFEAGNCDWQQVISQSPDSTKLRLKKWRKNSIHNSPRYHLKFGVLGVFKYLLISLWLLDLVVAPATHILVDQFWVPLLKHHFWGESNHLEAQFASFRSTFLTRE